MLEASWALWGLSRGPLGALLGLSWGLLGGLGGFLGRSWRPSIKKESGAYLGPPPRGPKKTLLGPLLERSWGALGRSWGRLGALLGLSWGPLGLSWGHLGASEGHRKRTGEEAKHMCFLSALKFFGLETSEHHDPIEPPQHPPPSTCEFAQIICSAHESSIYHTTKYVTIQERAAFTHPPSNATFQFLLRRGGASRLRLGSQARVTPRSRAQHSNNTSRPRSKPSHNTARLHGTARPKTYGTARPPPSTAPGRRGAGAQGEGKMREGNNNAGQREAPKQGQDDAGSTGSRKRGGEQEKGDGGEEDARAASEAGTGTQRAVPFTA